MTGRWPDRARARPSKPTITGPPTISASITTSSCAARQATLASERWRRPDLALTNVSSLDEPRRRRWACRGVAPAQLARPPDERVAMKPATTRGPVRPRAGPVAGRSARPDGPGAERPPTSSARQRARSAPRGRLPWSASEPRLRSGRRRHPPSAACPPIKAARPPGYRRGALTSTTSMAAGTRRHDQASANMRRVPGGTAKTAVGPGRRPDDGMAQICP